MVELLPGGTLRVIVEEFASATDFTDPKILAEIVSLPVLPMIFWMPLPWREPMAELPAPSWRTSILETPLKLAPEIDVAASRNSVSIPLLPLSRPKLVFCRADVWMTKESFPEAPIMVSKPPLLPRKVSLPVPPPTRLTRLTEREASIRTEVLVKAATLKVSLPDPAMSVETPTLCAPPPRVIIVDELDRF